jgi:hypothetical protein
LEEDESRFAPEQEKALSRVYEGTVLLIRRSFQASRIEIVGRYALHCVNRRESGAPSNDRLFYGKQKVKTIRKYANVFTKILQYIWRTADIANRPRYRLTDNQQQALTELRCVASGRVANNNERDSVIQASSDFWIAVFDHDLKDDEYENAILSGLAVLGAYRIKNG